MRHDCPDAARWHRHISKGAWPFSTQDHGWPISDCSAEGLKAALRCAAAGEEVAGPGVPEERLFDCVNVILSYQARSILLGTAQNCSNLPAYRVLLPVRPYFTRHCISASAYSLSIRSFYFVLICALCCTDKAERRG